MGFEILKGKHDKKARPMMEMGIYLEDRFERIRAVRVAMVSLACASSG